MYVYIYIYPGKRFLSFGIARGPDPDSPGPGGPGTGVPSTGSGVLAISGTTMSDKSRYDHPLNVMIASKSPYASIWTPTWPNLG